MVSTSKQLEDADARKIKEVIRLLNLALDDCYQLLREIEPATCSAEASSGAEKSPQ